MTGYPSFVKGSWAWRRRLVALAIFILAGSPLPGLGKASSDGATPPVIFGDVDEVQLFEPVTLTVNPPRSGLGAERVVNGDFSQGLGSWTVYTAEVGAGAQVAAPNGRLNVSATQAEKSGHISVFQTLPGNSSSTFLAEVKARAPAGDFPLLQLGFREQRQDGTDIAINFVSKAIGRDWTVFNWTWTRQETPSKHLFYLRVQAIKGHSYAVEFDDASVRSAPNFAWYAQDGRIIESSGPTAQAVFEEAGDKTVTVRALGGSQELWSAHRKVTVVQNPVTASLQVTPGKDMARHVTLMAANLVNPQISFRLADPEFALLGKAWTVSGYETGNQVSFSTAPGGRLRITAPETTSAGSLKVQQRIPVLTADTVRLTIPLTATSGQHLTFSFAETNITGSTATQSFSFTGPYPAPIEIEWKPQRPNPSLVIMSIVAQTVAGQTTDVLLGPIKYEGGVKAQWKVDGRLVPETSGLTASAYVQAGLYHHVDLKLTDASGQQVTLSKDFQVTAAEYHLIDDFPENVLLGNRTSLSFTHPEGRLHQESQIANGDFSAGKAGWSLWDNEVGGTVTWQIAQEDGQSYSRLTAAATKSGAIHTSRPFGPACSVVVCGGRVEYRSAGNITPVLLLLPPRPGGGYGPGKTVTLAPSATWRAATWELDPAPVGSTWQVYLRANLNAGQTGSVDYRNLTVYPRVEVDWKLEGPSGSARQKGPVFGPIFTTPGAHELSLTVTDAWGQTGKLQKSLDVVPLEIYPSLDGQAAIREQLVATAGDVRFGFLDADGEVLWEHSLGTDGGETKATSPPTKSVQVKNQRFYLPTSTAADRFFLQTSERLTIPWPRSHTPDATARVDPSAKPDYGLKDIAINYRIVTEDRGLQEGQATIVHAGTTLETTTLRAAAGSLEAEFRLPLALTHQEVQVNATLSDVWGRTTSVRPVAFALEPHRIDAVQAGDVPQYRPFEVRAQVPDSELGAELLTNRDFTDAVKNWTAYLAEIPGAATVTSENGALVLSANHASKSGNFAANQRVRLDSNSTFILSYAARTAGTEYASLIAGLQQYDAQGTQIATKYIPHPLAREWNRYEWSFPRVKDAVAANVVFAVPVKANHAVRVEVDDASFRAGPQISWEAHSGRVIAASGTWARISSETAGEVNVTASTVAGHGPTWTTAQTFAVRASAAQARLALDDPTIRLDRPLAAYVYDVVVPDSTFQVLDSQFAELGKAWAFGGGDLAGPVVVGQATDENGRAELRVEIPAAVPAGKWEMYQTLPAYDSNPVQFYLRLASTGDLKEYYVRLKETNATGTTADSYINTPANGPGTKHWEFTWTPKLNAAKTVELRVGFTTLGGHAATVVFSPIVAFNHATANWTLDGKTIATGVLAVSTILGQPGNHSLQFALDSLTNPVVASLDFEAERRTLEIPDVLPRVGLQQPALGFDLSPIPDTLFGPQLLNGEFRDDTKNWAFWGKEVGENSTFSVVVERGVARARLEASATQAGSIHISQRSAPTCLVVKCILEFDYRTEGAAVPVLYLGDPDVKLIEPHLAASASWTRHAATWQPQMGITPTIYLRARFQEGTQGAIEFRNVHLYPATKAEWTFEGPSGVQKLTGLEAKPILDRPGGHTATVGMEDAWGQKGSLTRNFTVLPARLYQTLTGQVGVKAMPNEQTQGSLVLYGAGGPIEWGLDLGLAATERATSLPVEKMTFEGEEFFRFDLPQHGILVLTTAEETFTISLEELARRMPPAVGGPEANVRYAGAAAYLDFRIPTSDASIQTARVLVRQGNEEIANQTLRPTGQAFEASVRLPPPIVGHTYLVEFQYDDVWGDVHVISYEAPVEVGTFPLLVKAIVFVALAGLALGLSFGIRRWKSRGRGRNLDRLLDA